MTAFCGRNGQALVETLLAAIIVTFAFLCLFRLSHLLTAKILAEHAAMRVARARTVGLNNFMCLKAARISVIPVAGERLWPVGEEFDYEMERARSAIYMNTPNNSVARGVLDYTGWGRMWVWPGDGTDSEVRMTNDWFSVSGEASLEHNYDFYLEDMGL
jgi:hypothetical protein